MNKPLFDFDDLDFNLKLSDDLAIDSDFNFKLKIADNLSMDIETGDIHFTSSWDDEEDY